MFNSESVVDVKPGDSGILIEYQVDEFTGTWSAEWSVACSHIILSSWVRYHHLPTFHLCQCV